MLLCLYDLCFNRYTVKGANFLYRDYTSNSLDSQLNLYVQIIEGTALIIHSITYLPLESRAAGGKVRKNNRYVGTRTQYGTHPKLASGKVSKKTESAQDFFQKNSRYFASRKSTSTLVNNHGAAIDQLCPLVSEENNCN